MCDIVILETGKMLKSVSGCYKNQKCVTKLFIIMHILESLSPISLRLIQFVCEYYKTQEMCVKAVDTCPFVFGSVPDQY